MREDIEYLLLVAFVLFVAITQAIYSNVKKEVVGRLATVAHAMVSIVSAIITGLFVMETIDSMYIKSGLIGLGAWAGKEVLDAFAHVFKSNIDKLLNVFGSKTKENE